MPSRRSPRAAALDGVRVLVGALSRSARSVERRSGITNAQLFVLRQLARSGTLSLNELGSHTLTRQSTVSTVVARLVRRGLVRRTRALDDRRRLVLQLTPSARRLLSRAPEPPSGRLLEALNRLPAGELRSLVRGLDALTRALGLEPRGAGMLFEG